MLDQPSSKPINRLLLLGLIVPCLLISIPAIIAYHAQQQLSDSFRWVSHTIEVQNQLQHLVALLLDAESNQRAFMLSPMNYMWSLTGKLSKRFLIKSQRFVRSPLIIPFSRKIFGYWSL